MCARRPPGALGKLGSEAVDPLVGALGDESASVRQAAAGALGETRDVRALAPLLAALDDESSEVRCTAAWTLGAIGDEGAVQRLIDTFKDPVVAVRQVAATLSMPSAGAPVAMPRRLPTGPSRKTGSGASRSAPSRSSLWSAPSPTRESPLADRQPQRSASSPILEPSTSSWGPQ